MSYHSYITHFPNDVGDGDMAYEVIVDPRPIQLYRGCAQAGDVYIQPSSHDHAPRIYVRSERDWIDWIPSAPVALEVIDVTVYTTSSAAQGLAYVATKQQAINTSRNAPSDIATLVLLAAQSAGFPINTSAKQKTVEVIDLCDDDDDEPVATLSRAQRISREREPVITPMKGTESATAKPAETDHQDARAYTGDDTGSSKVSLPASTDPAVDYAKEVSRHRIWNRWRPIRPHAPKLSWNALSVVTSFPLTVPHVRVPRRFIDHPNPLLKYGVAGR